MAKIEKRKIDELKNHPRQAELAGDISDDALAELARDMDDRGLQHAVVILPDGIIVAGHQRVRAARLLNWTEIDVIVRYDTVDANDPDVLYDLVADNVFRRQADAITIARSYRNLKALDKAQAWNELRYADCRDTRDRIGKVLGMTGRNLDRLEKLLDLPRALQDAVSNKTLTQMDALQIRRLPEDTWQGVADAMAAGRPVKEILAECLPRKASPARSTHGKCYARLVSQLSKAVSELGPHVDDVVGTLQVKRAAVVLEHGIGLLKNLWERELQIEQQRQAEQDCDHDCDDDFCNAEDDDDV